MANGVYDPEDTDLLSKERNPNSGQSQDDATFDALTSPEHMAKDGQSGERSGLYNPGGDDKTKTVTGGGGNEREPRTRAGKVLAAAKTRYGAKYGKFFKKKWVIGLAVGGGSMAGMLLLLLVFLSAFQVPHLMENITKYQFSQVFNRMNAQNERAISTKISVAAANSAAGKKITEKYGKFMEKPNAWNPNKQIALLETNKQMKFNYSGSKLTSVTLADGRELKPQTKFFKGLIPGYTFIKNRQFTNVFRAELQASLRANEVGPYVRGKVYDNLRKQLGISRVAWAKNAFSGKTKEQVRLAVEAESARRTRTVAGSTSSLGSDKKATQDLVDENEKVLKDPKKLQETVDNGGVSKEAEKIMSNVRAGSFASTAVSTINTGYAIAAPLCIVYEGSMAKSGPTIDANHNAQLKAADNLSTVSDQMKDGNTMVPEVANAYADKLGPNMHNFNAMKRASGDTVDTTSNSTSPHTSASGNFTIFDSIPGMPDNAASIANKVGDEACPLLLSNEGIAVGVLASLAANVASGGGIGVVTKAASTAVKKVATGLVTKGARKEALSQLGAGGSKISKLLGTTVKSAGKIAATTLVARAVVANQAGEFNNGLEQQAEYADMVDSGEQIRAGEVMRRQQFGIALPEAQAREAAAEGLESLAKANDGKSAYERYFALSNPRSLLTNFGYSVKGVANRGSLTSFASSVREGANPFTYLAKFMMNRDPKVKAANLDMKSLSYGNITFAWTKQEMERITNVSKHPTYVQLENWRLLDESGQSEAIAETYGKCFTDSVGTLLEKGYIIRDNNGNVLNDPNGDPTDDKGLCSPNNLTFTNNAFGPEMVFRWRVAQADDIDFEEKLNQQEITAPEAVAGSESGGSQFTISSYNIYYNTNDSDPGYSKTRWKERLSKVANIIKNPANRIEVAGLQEVRQDQWALIQEEGYLGSGYGIYPTNYADGGYASQNPIVWDAQRFTMVESGTKTIPGAHVTDNGHYESSNTQVRLKDNTTGQEFFVINTHEPVANGTIEGRFLNANKRAEYVKNQLAGEGIPIFLTGDFNAKYTANNPNQKTKGGLKANLSYCILTNGTGLRDAYDASKNLNGTCPSYGKKILDSNPAGPVDHIFMTESVEATKYDYSIGPPKNGSKGHNVLIVEVTIPGTGTAGGATPIPYANPVFNQGTADPSVIRGDDGTYHVYATGGTADNMFIHLSSKDLVSWKREARTFEVGTNVPWLRGERWAPDIAKTGDHYTLTFSGAPTGNCDNRRIGYATAATAAGPFKYRGVLVDDNNGCGYDIDPKLTETSAGLVLYYGSGPSISAYKINMSADGTLKKNGGRSILLPKTNESTLVEGAWVYEKEGWYYMFYSSGSWSSKSGGNEYQTRVARSKNPLGPFEKLDKPVLTGAGEFRGPGHNSVTSDNAGNDWIVYHAWYKNNRVLMIDPIRYENGWPVVNNGHPSSGTQQAGPANGNTNVSVAGDTTGWAWPFSKNDWIGPFGSNVWGNRYCGSSCGRHAGIDMSGTGGKTAVAAHDGVVERVSYDSSCKYSVLIKATGTPYWYAYQHINVPSVAEGNTVKAGVTKIATVYNGGGSGCIQGPHLHFSVEKAARISAYADSAKLTCDITQVACAKKMTSLPPLCFLDRDGRNYGSNVSVTVIKGSAYCRELTGL